MVCPIIFSLPLAVQCVVGYQYSVFWTPNPANESVRHASVSRRNLQASTSWETFTLPDYDQTDDDGHDVLVHPTDCTRQENSPTFRSISLGISEGDGTLHIGFDQHDNDLRYRVSKPGVATNPSATEWTADIFGPILVSLMHFLHL